MLLRPALRALRIFSDGESISWRLRRSAIPTSLDPSPRTGSCCMRPEALKALGSDVEIVVHPARGGKWADRRGVIGSLGLHGRNKSAINAQPLEKVKLEGAVLADIRSDWQRHYWSNAPPVRHRDFSTLMTQSGPDVVFLRAPTPLVKGGSAHTTIPALSPTRFEPHHSPASGTGRTPPGRVPG